MSMTDVEATVQRASEVLRAGGLVVFPTETVYGIGALATSAAGLARLREFKERPDAQPFTVHVATPADAEMYVDGSKPLVRRLMRKLMPGPVTLVVDVEEETIAEGLKQLGLSEEHRGALWHGHTIGLRCPDEPTAQRVLAAAGGPVVASSANKRGQDPPVDAAEAALAVGGAAGLIIDGGRARFAKASTIVRIRTGAKGAEQIQIERGGVFDERYIRKLLQWTMVLVCSGNTCRSPMAELIAKQILAEGRKVGPEELEQAGIRVMSAGAYAAADVPPSPEAVEAMARQGLDLSKHRSKKLTVGMVREADVIYCMTGAHVEAVLSLDAAARGKTFLLDENGDIADPIGSSLTVYQRCAEMIRRRLEQRLREQEP
ncbi:MAG: threonylcarbamoyl-AMP synthase [Phycisphaeraceae bacterium]|nr:threonylcarbamoyl-AMP synthase [Phycisphaeraceae bacterium]